MLFTISVDITSVVALEHSPVFSYLIVCQNSLQLVFWGRIANPNVGTTSGRDFAKHVKICCL